MIHLITGPPGNGKTLYALNYVKNMAEKENRPVFYNGIPELKLPWHELENPEKWFDLQAGAIIVIDECQRIFRPRANGSAVPQFVSELETHRHKGFDVVLITQHPMLIDQNVRRLVGRHFHAVRIFGMAAANIHEWGQANLNCDKTRTGSTQHKFVYPKETYGWYKSAEVHTHKARIPPYLFVLGAVPVIIALLVWYFYSWQQKRVSPQESLPVAEQKQDIKTAQIGQPRPAEKLDYIASHVPEIEGLPHTAPRYLEVAKPVSVPYPAACVEVSKTGACKCYTNQGSNIQNMPQGLCRNIVANGLFLDFVGGAEPQPQQTQSPVQAAPVS